MSLGQSPYQNQPLVNDPKAEQYVIGSLLVDPTAYTLVSQYIDEDCFYDPMCRDIWKAVDNMGKQGMPIDVISVSAELSKQKSNVTALDLMNISAQIASSAHVEYHAIRLQDLGRRRKLWVVGQQLSKVGLSEEILTADAHQEAIESIGGVFEKADGVFTLDDAMNSLNEIMVKNATVGGVTTGTKTGMERFDEKGGLQKSDLIIVAGETSQGKALRMNEKILTPNGWILNKDIKVGDEVCSVDGEKSFVTGVFPQGVKDIYKMTFSDGRVAYSSGDHLWEVGASTFKSGNRILCTTEIKDMQENTSAFHNRMYVPMFCGKYGEEKDFIIHPYILGVLIGDGCLTRGAAFCTADDFVLEKVRSLCTMPIAKQNNDDRTASTYRISFGHDQKRRNVYYDELRRLGLLEHLAKDKFIPREYLDCCYQQRMELLNGLMDTDGEVDTYGCIHYSTVSEKLASDIVYLCRSLGFKCSVNSHKSAFNGKTYENHYRITIAGENEKEVCTLPRRKERIKGRKRVNNIIRSVEYVGREECQCIKVSHPRELFVISDFVVTHNTSLALCMTRHAIENGAKVAFYSMEMTKEQLTARLLSAKTNIPANNILYSGSLAPSEIRMIDDARGKLPGENLFFDDKSTSNIDSILLSIRMLKMQKDIDGAVVDYLQILNVNSRSTSFSREQAMGDAARRFKNLAKELNIWIIALSQLSRDSNCPEPNLNRLRDSGQIGEAADVVILVYRAEYYNRAYPAPFDNKDDYPTDGTAMIDVAKGRNIGTFKFFMGFNKNTTNFFKTNLINEDVQVPFEKPEEADAPF